MKTQLDLAEITSRNNVQITDRHGRETNSGTILFVHGFGCDCTMWRYVTPRFEADYRVITLDLVGSGKSDISAFNPDRYSTLEGYARDILEVAEVLELEKAILVGHSVSAIIGAIAAIEQPDRFSDLIMVAPSPCYINDPPEYYGGFERLDLDEMFDLMDKNYMGWAKFLAPLVMGTQSPELTQELETSFCSTDPLTARTFAQATFYSDYRSILCQVPIPCLVLQCSDDAITPLEVGEYVQQNLPHSTLVKMSATGDCPHLSHPEETIEAIGNYLK
ncbi:MAG: alpha/beta hydrolase [Cyanobacteria bacterium J06555_3]